MSSQSHPSPHEFYAAFLKVVNRENTSLLESWPNSPKHTASIRERIVPAIARELGMLHYIEYYQIDAVFYHERDTVNFIDPRWSYAKYISVALEHENECTTAAVEMNRLQLLNTPLTVLITYPPTKAAAEKILRKYAAIIQAADTFENASTHRRQMCILGYAGPKWEASIYEDGRFAPLILPVEVSTNI